MRKIYSNEPEDPVKFTRNFDRFYTRYAALYDSFIRFFPLWKSWLDQALPHIVGPRVLELSFGTGYLLSRYAGRYETYGVDYNLKLARLALNSLRKINLSPQLQVADAAALPYKDGIFDCVVNTMAFSGYPDAEAVLNEIRRVLAPGGRLVLVDVGYPHGRNAAGFLMAHLWKLAGDLLRDMDTLVAEHGFQTTAREIGGFGSVHLYTCRKQG
jgi:ubiquinone/menaquinone biosynthesis C-methylase UbiE